MSRLGVLLKEERARKEMSQLELAKACGVDRSMISHYERGTSDVPHDVLCRNIIALDSDKLRAQACFECQINSLTMPFLDKVDMHPMTVQAVILEELQEAYEALKQVKLANKRTPESLTETDRKELEVAGEQLVDLFAGITTLLSSWKQHYEFDVERQAIQGYKKLFERGYATSQNHEKYRRYRVVA